MKLAIPFQRSLHSSATPFHRLALVEILPSYRWERVTVTEEAADNSTVIWFFWF
jgi:hypothetical protein